MSFSSSFGYRPSTLLSLWDFAEQLPYNIFGLMQVSNTRCVRTELAKGCSIPYSEYVYQEPGYPNRNTLLHRIANAERRIADVLGYFTGPTCVSNEEHQLENWGQSIRLNWDKVIATGSCEYQRLDEGITQTREFINYRDDEPVPGADTPYYEVVRFRFKGIDPLQPIFEAPGFAEGQHTYDWTNLFIFETGLGPRDCDDTSTLGHRIRPYTCQYDPDDGELIIDMPIQMAVKWEAYGYFISDTGKLAKIDLCDPDNIIDHIEIYQRQICKPDGHAVLRPRCGVCNGYGSCQVCQLETINICLEKIDNVSGTFNVRPIINTAMIEVDGVWCPDECNPCWTPASWAQCCDQGYITRSCLQQPLQVCVDYISGCSECNCYITDNCAPHQIPDEPCDIFKRAIAAMAVAESTRVCECGCLGELYKDLQRDLREVSTTQRFLFREGWDEFTFGTKQGDVIAWEIIRNLRDFRVEVAII